MARHPTAGNRDRASSAPPSRSAAAAAARAAEAAEAAAREALRAAAEAARAAEREAREANSGGSSGDGVQTSVDATEWPPPPNRAKKLFFYAREFPGLDDGVYTTIALRNRGVDPEEERAVGLLDGWVGAGPALRRAQSTGVDRTSIFWV